MKFDIDEDALAEQIIESTAEAIASIMTYLIDPALSDKQRVRLTRELERLNMIHTKYTGGPYGLPEFAEKVVTV